MPTSADVAEALTWGWCGGFIGWRSGDVTRCGQDNHARRATFTAPLPPTCPPPQAFKYVTKNRRHLYLAFY